MIYVTKYVFRIVCSVRVCTENIYSKCVACFLALRFCLSVFVFVFVLVLLHSFVCRIVDSFQLVSTPARSTLFPLSFLLFVPCRLVHRPVRLSMTTPFSVPKIEPNAAAAATSSDSTPQPSASQQSDTPITLSQMTN